METKTEVCITLELRRHEPSEPGHLLEARRDEAGASLIFGPGQIQHCSQ